MQWAERGREERSGVGNFPGMGRETRRGEEEREATYLSHVGNWISYKNATLAAPLSLAYPPLPPADIYAEEILLQSQSFLRYDSRSYTYETARPSAQWSLRKEQTVVIFKLSMIYP